MNRERELFLGLAYHCLPLWRRSNDRADPAAWQKRPSSAACPTTWTSAVGRCRRAGHIDKITPGIAGTLKFLMISALSFIRSGHVRPWHPPRADADGGTAEIHSRGDRPTIAVTWVTGSMQARLRTGYLFLALSHSQRSNETLCTRPRRRGLRTTLAPLPSSSPLRPGQGFTFSQPQPGDGDAK